MIGLSIASLMLSILCIAMLVVISVNGENKTNLFITGEVFFLSSLCFAFLVAHEAQLFSSIAMVVSFVAGSVLFHRTKTID